MQKSVAKKINIELTHFEALILLELVSRLNKTTQTKRFEFDDQAEQRVMWDIESILEKQLPEVFADNYTDIIKQARLEVRDKE